MRHEHSHQHSAQPARDVYTCYVCNMRGAISTKQMEMSSFAAVKVPASVARELQADSSAHKASATGGDAKLSSSLTRLQQQLLYLCKQQVSSLTTLTVPSITALRAQ